ncbi:ephexin-1-like isoform X2 [Protopterus annectens]|nr:ephexin-1-like isoform X2 [Protopterus annectens]
MKKKKMSSATITTSEISQVDGLNSMKGKPQLPPKPDLKTFFNREKSPLRNKTTVAISNSVEVKVLASEDNEGKMSNTSEGVPSLTKQDSILMETNINKLSLAAEPSDLTQNDADTLSYDSGISCSLQPKRKSSRKTSETVATGTHEQNHKTASLCPRRPPPKRPSYNVKTKKILPNPSRPMQRTVNLEKRTSFITDCADDVFLPPTLQCPQNCPCICHLKQLISPKRLSSTTGNSTNGQHVNNSLWNSEPHSNSPTMIKTEDTKLLQTRLRVSSSGALLPSLRQNSAGTPDMSHHSNLNSISRGDQPHVIGTPPEHAALTELDSQPEQTMTQNFHGDTPSSDDDPSGIYCTMQSLLSPQEDRWRGLQVSSSSVEDIQDMEQSVLPSLLNKLYKSSLDKEVVENIDDGDYVEIHCSNATHKHHEKTSCKEEPQLLHRQWEKTTRSKQQVHSDKQVAEPSESRCPLPVITWEAPFTDWKTRLEHEPFYQIYSQDCINREIKEQLFSTSSDENSLDSFNVSPSCDVTQTPVTQENVPLSQNVSISRSLSESTADFVHSTSPQTVDKQEGDELIQSDEVSRRANRRRKKTVRALWQDMSLVHESGILARLNKRQLRLQESMFEVLSSEASYMRSLKVVINNFMASPEINSILTAQEKRGLFSTINKIQEASERFLTDLESHLEENLLMPNTCEILQHHAKNNFSVYIDYIRNQPYQDRTFHNLMKEKPQFAEVISRLQEDPGCNRLPLKSFLVLPFQRLTRLKILAENILTRTEPKSEQEESAAKALREVSKVLEECNKEVGIMKRTEEMVLIANKIEFTKMKAIPLISQSRWLVKQGEMSELSSKETFFGQKKFVQVYLFLFNDLLLITVRKGGDKFTVLDHAHRSLVDVREDNSDADAEGTFTLVLVQNHRGSISEKVLKACNETEKKRWIEALSPRMKESKEKEMIYEEWDCPQAQCLAQYTAQQEDELSLEPADVVSILRKTADGWYEGVKGSDDKRGWFPCSCVEEIMSEHVRRKNLRERYRVLFAAQQLSRKGDGLPRKSST